MTTDNLGGIEVLLLGASHSAALSPIVQQELGRRNIGSVNLSYDACIPSLGLNRYSVGTEQPCSKYMERGLHYARSAHINTLVITARTAIYLDGSHFSNAQVGLSMVHRSSLIAAAPVSHSSQP